MCGIAGYWDWGRRLGKDELHTRILGMTQSLRHRGPDDGGLWMQIDTGLALGHRRLAIRDLSPLGHQPMVSPDGRFVLVYNGEIYNAAEIAADLRSLGLYPQGSSDTEVVLLACMGLGIEATLERMLGMYAFALWDRKDRRLTLVRDRFGVKPLYWMQDGKQRFLFTSELKALRNIPDLALSTDCNAVALFLRYGYIPAPYSIWQKVYKLPAAHRLDVDATGNIHLSRYWDALAVARQGLETPLQITQDTEAKVTDELDALLTDAVQRRMVADVPIGAFLSGGIDSSLVTALMQKCSSQPIRTFSIGFEEADYNEAPFAAAIARHLGTRHTEMYVRARDAWDLIPDIPAIYDEPFADPSQIPTTLLSRLTRQQVTTVLSGDGGDELFAGYGRYDVCLKQAPSFLPPASAYKLMAVGLKILSPQYWDALANLLPKGIRPRNAGVRIHNFADLRLTGTFPAFYHRYYMQYWWHPSTILKKGKAPCTVADDTTLADVPGSGLGLMQYVDTSMYLAEDILTKVDRAAMSCSLENRVPLLDTRVFAFAWRIPENWRIRNGQGKYFLHRILHKYVPSDMVERPKMGFGIPVGDWLRGPLRPWAEELLDETSLEQQGILYPQRIHDAWQHHINGTSNWEYLLWIVLMLQAWIQLKISLNKDKEKLPIVIV